MSTEKSDRPAALKRAPRPAADNGVDPVDVIPAAKPEAASPASAPAAPVKSRREPTIPLSTRVALDVTEILDAAVAEGRAPSQRAAIEMAIRQTWGKTTS